MDDKPKFTLEISNGADEYEWEVAVEELEYLMSAVNPDCEMWFMEAHNFGWRNLQGYRWSGADMPLSFLRDLLPNTDWTARLTPVYEPYIGFEVTCWHHDSPTGESYTVRTPGRFRLGEEYVNGVYEIEQGYDDAQPYSYDSLDDLFGKGGVDSPNIFGFFNDRDEFDEIVVLDGSEVILSIHRDWVKAAYERKLRENRHKHWINYIV